MTEKTTFGAGCFWGVEAAFRKIKGVVSTAAGAAHGIPKHPKLCRFGMSLGIDAGNSRMRCCLGP